uniref:Phospholipase A2 n=1 Tax=Cyprinus carpio carpio TaxID=630221 RepID=A0A9J7XCL9_CYPCA
MLKREVKPYWNLSVSVLYAKIHQSYDYLSESDCYVILNLPTASARTHRTKTISNSDKPEWNETFTFRVHSNIKNILEILIYDEDPLMRDDHCATILFDINNLTPGKKETKCFIINDKTKDELWVEFEITKSSETPTPCVSNGVLVAGPFCELNVEIDKLLKKTEATQNMVLKLKGAYKEDFVISNSEESSSFLKTLRYYVNRDLETELNLTSETVVNPANVGTVVVDAAVPDPVDSGLTSISLKPLPAKQQITVSLPLGENKVDLQLKTDDRSHEELDVRLDFDIPVEEKNFLVKRKKIVSQALQKALRLSSAPEPSKVPVVAVVCSGGGSRALTGTYGSLQGLQKIQLLDAVSYITGVSGATWALGSVYGDPNWSKGGFDKSMESIKKELSKKALSMFSSEQLMEYKKRMEEREKEGHLMSLIDMWGLALEYLFQGKKPMGTLSGMQRTVSEGQNPLPIFTAVNLKQGKKESIIDAEWCEFTPYEVGFPKYGAFVPAQNFGSEYYLGHMVKKLPETGLSFLVGMWSSIFSINLTDIWSLATGVSPSWTGVGVSNTETDSKPTALGTHLIRPVTDFAKMLCDFMTSRPIVSQMYNFLRGFNLHTSYSENTGFIAWKDTHPDAFPNTMTPADPVLGLVDAGFAVNAGFPPLVRSHRHVDVILSLNYSWNPDQFKVIKQSQEYCADRKIPFPKIDFKKVESEPLKEVYVFEDKDNPEAPIVLHFPLVNVSFKQFKAPGVKREGEKELKEGAVDVEFNSSTSSYLTHKLTYTPDDFQRLINLTSYNIQNNKDVILNALNKALNRNRERQTGDDSHGKKEKAAVGKTSSASTPKTGSQKNMKN